MSEPEQPKPDPKLVVNGVEYDLVPVKAMTFRELLYAKALSGGMNPFELEGGLRDLDPEAWLAVATISVQRVNEEMGPGDFDEVEFGGLVEPFLVRAQDGLVERIAAMDDSAGIGGADPLGGTTPAPAGGPS